MIFDRLDKGAKMSEEKQELKIGDFCYTKKGCRDLETDKEMPISPVYVAFVSEENRIRIMLPNGNTHVVSVISLCTPSLAAKDMWKQKRDVIVELLQLIIDNLKAIP